MIVVSVYASYASSLDIVRRQLLTRFDRLRNDQNYCIFLRYRSIEKKNWSGISEIEELLMYCKVEPQLYYQFFLDWSMCCLSHPFNVLVCSSGARCGSFVAMHSLWSCEHSWQKCMSILNVMPVSIDSFLPDSSCKEILWTCNFVTAIGKSFVQIKRPCILHFLILCL
jgi:hypothetical protein